MPARVTVEREVPVEDVDRDYDCFPRERIDSARVEEFAELYQDGGLDALPPVLVVYDPDGRLVRADGEHRLCALEQLEFESARVAIVTANQADPAQLAYEIALESTVSAKPLTRAERQAAVVRLLEERPDLSDRRIAALAGVSHQTVGRIRERGPVDHAAGIAGRPVAPEQVALKLLRSFEKLRQARGLGFVGWLIGSDRTGQRFASALQDVFGAESAIQARLFSAWLIEAAELLEAEEL